MQVDSPCRFPRTPHPVGKDGTRGLAEACPASDRTGPPKSEGEQGRASGRPVFSPACLTSPLALGFFLLASQDRARGLRAARCHAALGPQPPATLCALHRAGLSWVALQRPALPSRAVCTSERPGSGGQGQRGHPVCRQEVEIVLSSDRGRPGGRHRLSTATPRQCPQADRAEGHSALL